METNNVTDYKLIDPKAKVSKLAVALRIASRRLERRNGLTLQFILANDQAQPIKIDFDDNDAEAATMALEYLAEELINALDSLS